MFSLNKLVTKTIIRPDLTRSVCSARGKRFGFYNHYMSGRNQKYSGPNPNYEPFYKFYDHHYYYHHGRGLCPKIIVGMIILGLVVCKYEHSRKTQNHRCRDKGLLSNGESNDLATSPVKDEDQSSKR